MTTLSPRFAHLNAPGKPEWLNKALTQLGVAEVTGAKSNPRIIEYRADGETLLGGDDGAVPWCAIFINAMLRRAGAAGSKSAMARSFLNHKAFISCPAQIGAIAVKSSNRGPASGHVGFYVGEDGLFIYLLGGNQNDEVNIQAFKKKDFLGFRWPAGVAQPKGAAPFKLPRPQLPHEKKLAAAVSGRPVREA